MTISLDSYTVQEEHRLTPELHAFILQAYTKLFGEFVDDPQDGPADLRNFDTTYMVPGGRFITLREQDTIIGIFGYRPYDRRFKINGITREDLAFHAQTTVEVLRLFIAETHRSKGLASRLIEELVILAKEDKVDVMYLHTHAFLTGARNLWEKHGWNVIVIDNDEPWNTIHMARDVGSEVKATKARKLMTGSSLMVKDATSPQTLGV
jgi:GNAT superfamily N-acetyltransferase